MSILYVNLGGDLSDGTGSPVSGTITFSPSAWLTDATSTIFPPSPVTVPLSPTGMFSVALMATDNTEPPPGSWLWNVKFAIAGTPVRIFSFELLHANGAEQNLAAIIPIPPADVTAGYTAGGDLDGNYPDPQVVATHLTAPLPIAQGGTGNTSGAAASFGGTVAIANGGTGQVTQAAALTALAGTQSAGKYLRSDGTSTALDTIRAADLPAATTGAQGAVELAGDLAGTGTSPQVTGTHLASPLPVAQGGTGSTTQNYSGLLTMTPVKTSGYSASPGDYVRADATSASLTVMLPSAPANLTAVGVKMTGTSGTNTVTVSCQGSDVLNKSGGSTSYVLATLNQGAVFQYNSAGAIWLVTADNLSLAQLDTRFLPATSLSAYELLAGGVSSGVQQVAGTGTSGQYLISNGPSSLPSWQAGTGGSGMVNPMTTSGDIIYENSSPAPARLAGNSTGTKQFLSMTSSVPSWGALSGSDVPTLNQSTTGTAAGLSATLAIASGGTGATSASAALTALGAAPIAGAAFTKAITSAVVALTDAATITVDASLGNHFRVTLGGNRTLGAPSNPVDGQKITFEIIQDATGSRTLAYNAAYAFSTDIPSPTLTTTASKRDYLGFCYDSGASKWHLLAIVRGF